MGTYPWSRSAAAALARTWAASLQPGITAETVGFWRHQARAHCAIGIPSGTSVARRRFHLLEVAVEFFGIQRGAVVVRKEGGAGLVFAGQESTCQWHAGEDAELGALRVREVVLFGTPVEAVINYL